MFAFKRTLCSLKLIVITESLHTGEHLCGIFPLDVMSNYQSWPKSRLVNYEYSGDNEASFSDAEIMLELMEVPYA